MFCCFALYIVTLFFWIELYHMKLKWQLKENRHLIINSKKKKEKRALNIEVSMMNLIREK